MANPASREPQNRTSPETAVPAPSQLTSDIPEDLRGGRYVTLTVGGDVDMRETHPTDANPEARG